MNCINYYCYQMTSSDGQGNAGTKGDCGFRNIFAKGDYD